MQLYTVLNL